MHNLYLGGIDQVRHFGGSTEQVNGNHAITTDCYLGICLPANTCTLDPPYKLLLAYWRPLCQTPSLVCKKICSGEMSKLLWEDSWTIQYLFER